MPEPISMASAGIMAGSQLVGGLLGAKSQAEVARRQRIMDALGKEMQAKKAAAEQLQQGTQSALGQWQSGITAALR